MIDQIESALFDLIISQTSAVDLKKMQPSKKQLKQLKAVKIDDHGPGTIQRDFFTMMDAFGSHGLTASGKHNLIPQKYLEEINSRLSKPVVHKLKRPVFKSFPNIQGLFLLLRGSMTMVIQSIGPKPKLVIDPEMRQFWQGLNPTERYFNLLDVALDQTELEMIGERSRGWMKSSFLQFADDLERDRDGYLKTNSLDFLKYSPGYPYLFLLEMFGMVELTVVAPQPGKGWEIQAVRITETGDALMDPIAMLIGSKGIEYIHQVQNVSDEADVGPPPLMRDVLQPYFPEWKRGLPGHEAAEMVDGIYRFKVSLKNHRVWWRIDVPGHLTFDSLSDVILAAAEFDYDHLYQFEVRDTRHIKVEIGHLNANCEYDAEEVVLGAFGLKPGKSFQYIYDFGDWWQFKITLEGIQPPDKEMQECVIVQTHGKPPQQYPYWE